MANMTGANGILPSAHAPPPPADKTRRRLMLVSAINGWSVALIGVFVLLVSLIVSFSAWGVLIGAAAVASGCMELAGRRRVKQGRPEAGRWLAGSQLLLLGAIFLYAGYQLATFNAQSLADQVRRTLQEAGLGDLSLNADTLNQLVRIFRAFYAAVMLATLLYQGGLCLYYTLATRKLAAGDSLGNSE